MRAFLVITALWANVEPVRAAEGPIGPWIAKLANSAMKKCAAGKVWFDNWASRTQEVIFDVQVISLEEEAANEIRFLADVQRTSRSPLTVIRSGRVAQVRALLPHIVDAGHARQEAEHTAAAAVGRPAMAIRYIKHPMRYIDARGNVRSAITRVPDGDMITLVPSVVSLTSTQLQVAIHAAPPLPGNTPAFRPQMRTTGNSISAPVGPEEQLLILREPIARDTGPAREGVVPVALEPLDAEKPRATLFIITPRRALRGTLGPNNPANQPQIFRF
ncbi:hypothetical protein Pan44_18550 [Caulifigura coniformis]|uniref:Bacterial type II and III secretion system protein n=1 Tax=Caulifigura coniformis TaxID=2527983 RepID=A0A517SCH7_9PLAN|nr:hypothetical protein [Caulifigura coniformis]QDT53831.1 hypothetical protein Pan44_18550 [Caulifigura coniformis]